VNAAPSNGLGVASFVCSIVGWVTCGLLCPLGLLFGLIALARPPRGFAIAGTVLGLLGSIFLVVAGIAIIAAVLGLGVAAALAVDEVQIISAAASLDNTFRTDGAYPDDATGQADVALIVGAEDAEKMRYRRFTDDTAELRLTGGDGLFDTSDDRVYELPMTTPGLERQPTPTPEMPAEPGEPATDPTGTR
jgi:hypothetical protein